jgi:hypothetical protein
VGGSSGLVGPEVVVGSLACDVSELNTISDMLMQQANNATLSKRFRDTRAEQEVHEVRKKIRNDEQELQQG